LLGFVTDVAVRYRVELLKVNVDKLSFETSLHGCSL